MAKLPIIFRCDGSGKIGLGHLYRSAALAGMLSDRFDCYLVSYDLPEGLRETFQHVYKGIFSLTDSSSVIDPARLLELIAALPYARSVLSGAVVVLDNYYFDTRYQSVLRDSGLRVVCVDDIHAHHFVADAVINHAGGVRASDYSAETYTKFYLGPRYALVGKAFTPDTDPASEAERKGTFICLGGADPGNATLLVLRKAIGFCPDSRYDVVVGAGYAHIESMNAYVASFGNDITVSQNLSADALAGLMKRSAFGITSPSTVSFEYLSAGGLLYLKQIADNQNAIFKYYVDDKIALSFDDDFPCKDEIMTKTITNNKKLLFDGEAGARYLDIFTQLHTQ